MRVARKSANPDRPEPGIEVRHRTECRRAADKALTCNCKPAYRAEVWNPVEERRIRRTFATRAAARGWRQDHLSAKVRKQLKADRGPKFKDAAEEWLEDARNGHVVNRGGDQYKPGVIRSYETSLRLRIYPEIGASRVNEITRDELQALVKSMQKANKSASTIRNSIIPVRAIYRERCEQDSSLHNPTVGLKLPRVQSEEIEVVTVPDAEAMIEALPTEKDQALWATAIYAGLRLGELQALRWKDVDLDAGFINVRKSWDAKDGEVEPKSRAGRRSVPIPPRRLGARLKALDRGKDRALVFGTGEDQAFAPNGPRVRAKRAWEKVKLPIIGFHAARHTYASIAIANGINAKEIQKYMGHSSITVTMDRYAHLFPDHGTDAAAKIDAGADAQMGQ